MKIRALSSFSHPQEDARAEDRDTKRWWIPMDPHRRATQTRLLRLAHAVKCRRQRSPCRRQQLRLEAQPPCALLHRAWAQMPAFGPHFHTGNKAQPKERLRVNKLELELATKHRPAPFFSYGSFSILTNLILTHITSNSYPHDSKFYASS